MADPNELVQYVVINRDLGMTKGKVAAQAMHAAVLVAVRAMLDGQLQRVPGTEDGMRIHLQGPEGEVPPFAEWLGESFKKVTLRGTQEELETLERAGFQAIRDAGHTQVDPNSLTVVALPPMRRFEAEPLVGHLSLY